MFYPWLRRTGYYQQTRPYNQSPLSNAFATNEDFVLAYPRCGGSAGHEDSDDTMQIEWRDQRIQDGIISVRRAGNKLIEKGIVSRTTVGLLTIYIYERTSTGRGALDRCAMLSHPVRSVGLTPAMQMIGLRGTE